MAQNPDSVPPLRRPIFVDAEHSRDPRAAQLLTKPPGVQRGLAHVAPAKAVALSFDDVSPVRPTENVVDVTSAVLLVTVDDQPTSIGELVEGKPDFPLCTGTEDRCQGSPDFPGPAHRNSPASTGWEGSVRRPG